MINFRFHLVSLGAVLLALAAGIALGSGPLDKAGNTLRGETTSAADPAVVAFDDAYAARTIPGLINGKLSGQSVLVLSLPDVPDEQLEGVVSALGTAGANVTGQVEMSEKLLDPANRQFSEGVAQQAGSDVAEVTEATDSYGRVGAALGRAFVSPNPGAIDETAATIRSALTEAELISTAANPESTASLVVIVAGPKRSGVVDQGSVVAALAAALEGAGSGVVVAGPASSSTDGGVVQVVRDRAEGGSLSSVDVTDSAAGRALVVLALASEAAGTSGEWGTSRSANGALPG